MRTDKADKELLTLLRDGAEALLGGLGLCHVTQKLSAANEISYSELLCLKTIICRHAPPRRYSTHSWPPGEVQPRIDWLNSLLQRIENGEQL